MSGDPQEYELAAMFIDDVIRDVAILDPAAAHRLERAALVQRLAEAIQQAIEDECVAIRKQVLP